MKRRVFLVVLDSFGIGYEPDAADFGDVGSNTLATIMKSENCRACIRTAIAYLSEWISAGCSG